MMPVKRAPRISIVIPSYNQARYLEAAILSVLGQTYPDFELFVLDGGSTDGSIEIIKHYENAITKWRSCRDAGQASAIAEGLAHATGDILCYLNSDDMYLPGAFRRMGEVFEGRLDRPHWAIGGNIRIDGSGSTTRFDMPMRVTQRSMLIWGSGFVQPAAFWNRIIYEAVGGLNPHLQFCMDYDLFLKFAEVARPSVVHAYVAAFRDHASSKSATLRDIHAKERVELEALYLRPVPATWRRMLRLRYWIQWKALRVRTLAAGRPLVQCGWPHHESCASIS